jgi:hypothetical protein
MSAAPAVVRWPLERRNEFRRALAPAKSAKCDGEQARAKQHKTGNGHSEETVRSEFFTHGTSPIARVRVKLIVGSQSADTTKLNFKKRAVG